MKIHGWVPEALAPTNLNKLVKPNKNSKVGASYLKYLVKPKFINGWELENSWVGARKYFCPKYPHFSTSLKRIGNTQNNVICAALLVEPLIINYFYIVGVERWGWESVPC